MAASGGVLQDFTKDFGRDISEILITGSRGEFPESQIVFLTRKNVIFHIQEIFSVSASFDGKFNWCTQTTLKQVLRSFPTDIPSHFLSQGELSEKKIIKFSGKLSIIHWGTGRGYRLRNFQDIILNFLWNLMNHHNLISCDVLGQNKVNENSIIHHHYVKHRISRAFIKFFLPRRGVINIRLTASLE